MTVGGDAGGHLDDPAAVLDPGVDRGGTEGAEDADEDALGADPAQRNTGERDVNSLAADLDGTGHGVGHDEEPSHEGRGGAEQRVAVDLAGIAVGDAERREDGHQREGRVRGLGQVGGQRAVGDGDARDPVGEAGERQVGDNQEDRAGDQQRRRDQETVTDRDEVLVVADGLGKRHEYLLKLFEHCASLYARG